MSSSRSSQPERSLAVQAQAELERRRRRRAGEPLLDFIPDLTPRWSRPTHLGSICSLFERAETEEVRALASVSPQFGKTETLLHGGARYLLRHPERTIAYVSYSADIAHSKSRLARDYARRAGVRLRDDSSSVGEWRTPEGGGWLATGIGGQLTGHGAQLLIIDDPHKNRAEAESARLRDHVHAWARSTAFSRVHPGSSIIVVHTRWHEDDLIGRLSKELEEDDDGNKRAIWEVINLPALNDGGESLWPEGRPTRFLRRQRATLGEYDWWALYMGSPRPRGGTLFGDVHFYDALPTEGYRVSIGIDLAYSAKTHADYSVAVVLYECGGKTYVADVIRVQVSAPTFSVKLKELAARYPGVEMRAYLAGTELGSADFIRRDGVPLRAQAVTADKFIRAQPAAAGWRAGRILVPRDAPWLDAFISELVTFTGIDDPHDDQVDALAAAFDALRGPGGYVGPLPAIETYESPLEF